MSASRFLAAALTAIAMTTPSVADPYEERFADLKAFLDEGPIGSADVWLAKTAFGFVDPVALFFGYYDDLAACRDAARVLNAAYPEAGYVCTYALE